VAEQPVVQINLPKETPAGSGASLVYLLYLASLVLGVTLLIGVVLAYLNRGEAADWVKTHYTFQIRTFWIGLLFGAIGVVTAPIVIGFIVLVAAAVWLIIRCIKGLKVVSRGEPYPNPETWWI
jgi:uncharacterized membrane protein